MKRLLILLLLLPALAWGGEPIEIARMNPYILGSGVAAAACDPATNEVGSRDAATNESAHDKNYIYCTLRAADCSGELDTGYIYSSTDNSSTARICVYADDGDSTPDSGDTKVSCSTNTIGDTSTAWTSSVMDAGGNVTALSNYWVCAIYKTNNWNIRKGSIDINPQRAACSGTNCSTDDPPLNLGDVDGAWSASSTHDPSHYVSIK